MALVVPTTKARITRSSCVNFSSIQCVNRQGVGSLLSSPVWMVLPFYRFRQKISDAGIGGRSC
jgi:hypothetical protein